MTSTTRRGLAALCVIAGWQFFAAATWGQSFGVELHNTLMPASGGMGGVSIARPQDLTSSLNGNPATLTQFPGTQFTFSGTWVEPTFNLTQTEPLPLVGVDPYTGKSTAQGLPAGNIGVTQDLSALGLPATFGLGFVTTCGGFADFRQIPESNGTNSGLSIFSLPMAVGMDISERLSIGASLALGIAFFDGPFVDIGGMTTDVALRGTLGASYEVTEVTAAGFYYQTRQGFQFDNAVQFAVGPPQTVQMDLPENIGFGLANSGLMDGQLLLGVDVLYKLWDSADLYSAIYDNQWAVQLRVQYTVGCYKWRAGYVWAQDPLSSTPTVNVGGINVGDLPSVRYTQALLAITSEHRLTFGFGVTDALPGMDLDVMAGGMFRDTASEGEFTSSTIESYWVGLGLTWRFGCCN